MSAGAELQLLRPRPPEALLEEVTTLIEEPGLTFARFQPAPDVMEWLRLCYLVDGGALHNPDHAHLADARIAVMWTNVYKAKNGRAWAGSAQVVNPSGDRWTHGFWLAQVQQMFGFLPDFVLTLSAPAAADTDDWSWAALVDHELYHCHFEKRFGEPVYAEDERLKWALRGHDIEQFHGVVARFGARAAGVQEMVAAAAVGPLIAPAAMNLACGTCAR